LIHLERRGSRSGLILLVGFVARLAVVIGSAVARWSVGIVVGAVIFATRVLRESVEVVGTLIWPTSVAAWRHD